jgi:hypothetical protein
MISLWFALIVFVFNFALIKLILYFYIYVSFFFFLACDLNHDAIGLRALWSLTIHPLNTFG